MNLALPTLFAVLVALAALALAIVAMLYAQRLYALAAPRRETSPTGSATERISQAERLRRARNEHHFLSLAASYDEYAQFWSTRDKHKSEAMHQKAEAFRAEAELASMGERR